MRDERGQVLVVVALGLVVLLAAAAFTVDLGRRAAEERYLQNAADAGALAACSALIAGSTDLSAQQAGDTVARANLTSSPSGTAFELPPIGASLVYEDGGAGDPRRLEAGILVQSHSVRVAITSHVAATIGAIVGAPLLKAQGRAQCQLQGGPAVPIVARRYVNAPGPGNDFIDHAATSGTSRIGQVDTSQTIDGSGLIGYAATGRAPAAETDPGPTFELYGPGAKASNGSDFRGFIALDVRNFQDATSRMFYNGVTAGTTVQTLKDKQGVYTLTGYPGPGFPSVTNPSDPNDQVAVMVGNDSAMVVSNFRKSYAVGDRVLLALYNGTVMEIPDFSISPPGSFTVLATQSATSGPSFTVARNDAFQSTVTLRLRGDADAAAAGHPEYDIVPDPPLTPPAAGYMNEPTWSTDAFVPDKNGTRVDTSSIQTTAVPPGIYAAWLEGKSGDPYYQTRRAPVPVEVRQAAGTPLRDFSLGLSTTTGTATSSGATITLPVVVSTARTSDPATWASTNPVSLSWDAASFTDCSFQPKAIGAGQITFSSASAVPSVAGTSIDLNVSTVGLNAGCYRFNVRASGLNLDNRPVTHLLPMTITVATTPSTGSYVDLIGFAVFKVTAIDANSIFGQAVTGAYADPNADGLRRAQQPRLVDWNR